MKYLNTITILFIVSISSLFAQKRQTTEYLTLNTYVRDSVLQKPFKIGYLAYSPDSYYLTTRKYPLIITCHGNGQKGTLNPDILRKSFVPLKLDQGMNVEAVVISNDPDTNLPRVVFWESNFENLKQSYYQITFSRSLRSVSGKEKANDQFIYTTKNANDNPSRRCAFNQDGSWHVSHDETDPRWEESIPEFEFWFNLVNKIDKHVTDEVFKKTIISNLDESGYFNQY